MRCSVLAYKSIRELGLGKLALYAQYQAGLHSGLLRRQTARPQPSQPEWLSIRTDLLSLPSRQELRHVLENRASDLLAEADEILNGKVHLFGGPPVPLNLAPPGKLVHWTRLERQSWSQANLTPDAGDQFLKRQDIKFSWEVSRIGWAFALGRAYQLTQDVRYARAFWKYLEDFLQSNPPFLGVNWISAQEAALRIIALVFAGQVFAGRPETPADGMQRLAESIAAHAQRIPPTLSYARSQNNNHLLSEAAGLYTAGLFLPEHPNSSRWRQLGWRWFHTGLQAQISPSGEYIQHSTNYHRVMLHLSAWMAALWSAQEDAPEFPPSSLARLQAASHWLLALLDEKSGCVPNLGPNDGANILPLAACLHNDYRPVLQSTALFTGIKPISDGHWDEPLLWLQAAKVTGKLPQSASPKNSSAPAADEEALGVLRLPGNQSWAYLRWVHFSDRPGHADQLHLDLWWHGQNIALDAGTYLYNAPPPWDNSLARTSVHNTIQVNHQDQMTRAGRFLYLDWAQGELIARKSAADHGSLRIVAQHDGYRRLGVIHQREVTVSPGEHWKVEDRLIPLPGSRKARGRQVTACLHWHLPDLPWELVDGCLELTSPHGKITLEIQPGSSVHLDELRLTRAGELLTGQGSADPSAGWHSLTYGVKHPALSLDLICTAFLPLELTTLWNLSDRPE